MLDTGKNLKKNFFDINLSLCFSLFMVIFSQCVNLKELWAAIIRECNILPHKVTRDSFDRIVSRA